MASILRQLVFWEKIRGNCVPTAICPSSCLAPGMEAWGVKLGLVADYAVFLFKTAARLPQARISMIQVAKHIQHSSPTAPADMHQGQHPCILKLPRETLARHGWSRVGAGVSLDIQRMVERERCRIFIIGGRKREPSGGGKTYLSCRGCSCVLAKKLLCTVPFVVAPKEREQSTCSSSFSESDRKSVV